jgi:hypothetical protein
MSDRKIRESLYLCCRYTRWDECWRRTSHWSLTLPWSRLLNALVAAPLSATPNSLHYHYRRLPYLSWTRQPMENYCLARFHLRIPPHCYIHQQVSVSVTQICRYMWQRWRLCPILWLSGRGHHGNSQIMMWVVMMMRFMPRDRLGFEPIEGY